MKRDYYEILGISKTADEAEIKKAFRRLAKKYHPDVSQEADAEAKFKEANEAYEVLSDPAKRKLYDQYGHDAVNGQGAGPGGFGGFGGFEDIFHNFTGRGGQSGGFGGFEDVFENIFGGGFGGRRRGGAQQRADAPLKGEDIIAEATISLKEMMFGTTVNLNVNLTKNCQKCGGNGADSASDIQTCQTCKGHGVVMVQQRSILGIIQSEQTCPDCKGRGKIVLKKCGDCKGKGQFKELETIKIEVPRSISSEQQLRVREMGHFGVNGGPRGDVYLSIKQKPNAYYRREGYDLHLTLPVSFYQAILGGELVVPTLEGEIKIKLPAGSKNNQQFIIPKNGFYHSPKSDRRGNLIVTIEIAIPSNLSTKEKDALKDLAQATEFKVDLTDFKKW